MYPGVALLIVTGRCNKIYWLVLMRDLICRKGNRNGLIYGRWFNWLIRLTRATESWALEVNSKRFRERNVTRSRSVHKIKFVQRVQFLSKGNVLLKSAMFF